LVVKKQDEVVTYFLQLKVQTSFNLRALCESVVTVARWTKSRKSS